MALLTSDQRVRYARHLLLPELGEAAQLRLLASRARFAEHAPQEAREVAAEYLRRAGVELNELEHTSGAGEVLLVDLPELRAPPHLVQAAHALSGAFSAVEALKKLAGIGTPAELDLDLLSAEDV